MLRKKLKMQNNTLKATSAEDPFVLNINIAPKQHIWTSILRYCQNGLSSEERIQIRTVATSDMHKYSIKIQYGKICSQACWIVGNVVGG